MNREFSKHLDLNKIKLKETSNFYYFFFFLGKKKIKKKINSLDWVALADLRGQLS